MELGMSAGSPSPKSMEWRDRFVRFEKSGQTVIDFCLSEGVSQPSYYHWRKKLGYNKPSAGRRRSRSVLVSVGNGQGNFREVAVSDSSSDLLPKVRLPGDIELQLGHDPQLVQVIVKQLIESTLSSSKPQSC